MLKAWCTSRSGSSFTWPSGRMKQELEALNDSLQFELSSLKTYVVCLEEDNAELAEELKLSSVDRR